MVTSEDITRAVERHRFSKETGGRKRGEEDRTSFRRKGVVGDWCRYFTEEHKVLFKQLAGDMLIRLGYEEDNAW